MELKKIIEKFAERERYTKQALDHLFAILQMVEKITEERFDINIDSQIGCRWTAFDGHNWVSHDSYDEYDKKVIIRFTGKSCYLCEYSDYENQTGERIAADDIEYINLKDAQDAIEALFKKLSSIKTRKVIADKIALVYKVCSLEFK